MKNVVKLLGVASLAMLLLSCGSKNSAMDAANDYLLNKVDFLYSEQGAEKYIYHMSENVADNYCHLVKHNLNTGVSAELLKFEGDRKHSFDAYEGWIVPEDKGLNSKATSFGLLGFYRVFRNPGADNSSALLYDLTNDKFKTIVSSNGVSVYNDFFVSYKMTYAGWTGYIYRDMTVYDVNGNELGYDTYKGVYNGKNYEAKIATTNTKLNYVVLMIGIDGKRDFDVYVCCRDNTGKLTHCGKSIDFGTLVNGVLTVNTQFYDGGMELAFTDGAGVTKQLPAAKEPVKLTHNEDVLKWIRSNIPYVISMSEESPALYYVHRNKSYRGQLDQYYKYIIRYDLESGEERALELTVEGEEDKVSKFSEVIVPEDKGYDNENPVIKLVIKDKVYAYELTSGKLTKIHDGRRLYVTGDMIADAEIVDSYPNHVGDIDIYDSNITKLECRTFTGVVNKKSATVELVIDNSGRVLGSYYTNKPNVRTLLMGKVQPDGSLFLEGFIGDTYNCETWSGTLKDGVLTANYKYDYMLLRKSGSVSLTEQK